MILPSLPPHCSVSEFNTCEPLYQLCGKHNCLSHRFTAAPKQAQAGRAVTCGVISMQVQTFSCGSWQTYFLQASTPKRICLACGGRSLWALVPDPLARSNAFTHPVALPGARWRTAGG